MADTCQWVAMHIGVAIRDSKVAEGPALLFARGSLSVFI
ncbi:DUF397 domain-containing protein [Streptomyces sp. NPDC002078]